MDAMTLLEAITGLTLLAIMQVLEILHPEIKDIEIDE